MPNSPEKHEKKTFRDFFEHTEGFKYVGAFKCVAGDRGGVCVQGGWKEENK